MSHGPVHYDGDRLESLLFNPIDRPEVGNMLSSYLGPDSNFVSRLQITGMYSPLCTLMLVVSLDKLNLIMMNMQTPLPLFRKLG